MRRIVGLLVAAAFLGATGGYALADCAAGIAKVEPQIMNVANASKKTTAESELKEARILAQNKSEKECLIYLDAAKKTAGIK